MSSQPKFCSKCGANTHKDDECPGRADGGQSQTSAATATARASAPKKPEQKKKTSNKRQLTSPSGDHPIREIEWIGDALSGTKPVIDYLEATRRKPQRGQKQSTTAPTWEQLTEYARTWNEAHEKYRLA